VQRVVPPTRYPDRLEDLSTGGARVRTLRAVAPGEAVWLELPAGQDAIGIPASVVHVSAGGVGLRFHLDRQGAREVADVLREHLARSRQVLVVDDDPFVRRVLGDTLEEQGYEVQTAPDGLAALRALADGILGTMAVVTDVRMPVMDGIELVNRIRQAGGECDLGIVAVTGNAGAATAALRNAGVDEIVEKERGLAAILEAVDRVAWRARRDSQGADAPDVQTAARV
jgi:CheY-like chemotaxis protein